MFYLVLITCPVLSSLLLQTDNIEPPTTSTGIQSGNTHVVTPSGGSPPTCPLGTISDTGVINLSSHVLTPAQLLLLSKGLNFCPTPGEPDLGQLRENLDSFHTSLRRQSFFSLAEESAVTTQASANILPISTNTFSDPKFRIHSTWSPVGPSSLEAFITANKSAFNQIIPRNSGTNNLTQPERVALAELRSNPDIVIKPADKGSAVVVMDTSMYIAEAERQLNNGQAYMRLPNNPTVAHHNEITKVVDQLLHKGEIDRKCADYLVIKEPRTPQFYLLPKVHKGIIPPPGRPIVSGNAGPTERISQLVDHFLKPHVQSIRSYIRDTTHFLQILQEVYTLPTDTLLVTLDVTSLYTNIPQNEGIASVARLLIAKRPPGALPTKSSLLRLLSLGLKRNNFQFNGVDYLQVSGTAMGNPFAPSFANIFLSEFEQKHVYTYNCSPLLWKRYIDDIFIIWPHGHDELVKFVNHLNSVHATIKFTMYSSAAQVSFLDTLVCLNQDGTLSTRVYRKPTDTQSYLRYDSSHPRFCKDSIPYSQFLRIRRICSELSDFDKTALDMSRAFIERGYPLHVVESAFLKARRCERQSLLLPRRSHNAVAGSETKHFFVSQYNQMVNNTARSIIEGNRSLLLSARITTYLGRTPFIYGLRRNKNLQDSLVHSTLHYPPRQRENDGGTMNVCSTNMCRYCPVLDKSGRITCTSTGRQYCALSKVSCKSNNLIYCLTCSTCKQQYVGQTKRRLMDRMQGHFYHIKHNILDDPVGHHFNRDGHSGLADVTIHILQFIKSAPDSLHASLSRDTMEKKWIHRFHSMAPNGLNTME